MGVNSISCYSLIHNAQQAPFGHKYQMKWNMFSNIKVTKFGIEILEMDHRVTSIVQNVMK